MTIAIFGATGMVGKHLVKQALENGYKTIAFGRNIENLIDADLAQDNLITVKGYVFHESDVLNVINMSDVVLSALGGGFDGVDKTRSLGLKNITEQMANAGLKRIIAIGGMGILNADENTMILDTPDYPPQYVPVGKEHLQAYKILQKSKLDWTFVCPPFIVDRNVDLKYTTSQNYHPASAKNEIAAGNLAHFMLNDLKQNKYVHKRTGIADVE